MSGAGVDRIAVVGAGLVGGSIAAAAIAAGVPDVRVTDRDPGVRARARTQSWGDVVVDDLEAAVDGAQVIFLAVPSTVVPMIAATIAPRLAPDAILTDAASLKADLTLDVESRLRRVAADGADARGGKGQAADGADARGGQGQATDGTAHGGTREQTDGTAHGGTREGADVTWAHGEEEDDASARGTHPPLGSGAAAASAGPGSGIGPGRFVGGHPMAGSERSGPEAADGRLFIGATWVLTPTDATDDDVLPRLSTLLRRFGARVIALPARRHDELVAVVSHLPQVVASTLAAVAGDAVAATGDAVLAVAGGGFRDTTRIAASAPELWLPILEGNRAAVLEAVRSFQARFDAVAQALADADATAVTAVLQQGSDARRRLVPKEDVDDVVEVVVPLDDQPGQLAQAMTALGQAAVNVEDLAMRHSTEGARRGVLLLTIARAVEPDALAVLRGAGFAPHRGDSAGGGAAGAGAAGAGAAGSGAADAQAAGKRATDQRASGGADGRVRDSQPSEEQP